MAQITPTRAVSSKTTTCLVPRPKPRGGVPHSPQLKALTAQEGADRLERRVPVPLIDDKVTAATGETMDDKLVESAQGEAPAYDELYQIDNSGIRGKLPTGIRFNDGRTARVG